MSCISFSQSCPNFEDLLVSEDSFYTVYYVLMIKIFRHVGEVRNHIAVTRRYVDL
jgi:hypothetical protein